MEFDIEFLYRLTYVPARCRDPRKGTGLARTTVKIDEFDEAEVPVVMTVGNEPLGHAHGLGVSFDRFLKKPDGSDRRIRLKDGYFYVESVTLEYMVERARNLAWLNGTFLAEDVGPRKPGLDVGERRLEDTVTDMWKLRRSGLRDELTRDDNGASAKKKILEQASKMFAVDGVTYELCREPILRIRPDSEGNPEHGIVEAPPSVAERIKDGGAHYRSDWTSSLNHAAQVLEQAGVEEPRVSFSVLNERASCYDGPASDVYIQMSYALKELRRTIDATSLAALQVYYGIAETLGEVDHSSPSVSQELIDAAEDLVAMTPDPEIEAPMQQLAKARYMNAPAGSYQAPVNLDAGTGFGLMLDYVANYRDKWGHQDNAVAFARFALDRWYGRHPSATFDNGNSHRMASKAEDGARVTEIGSIFQVRAACRDLGVSYGEMEKSIACGSRLFRVGAGTDTVAVLASPAPGQPGATWVVVDREDIRIQDPLELVHSHLEKMEGRDAEIKQDQQLISVF